MKFKSPRSGAICATVVSLFFSSLVLAAPAQAAPEFDPLAAVQDASVLATASDVESAGITADQPSRTQSTVSAPQNIAIAQVSITPRSTALSVGASKSVSGVPVKVYSGKQFGVVTGKNSKGNNAGYISIRDASAPTSYDFTIGTASTVRLSLNADGSVTVTNSEGVFVNMIETPWATDAKDKSLQTSFTINGNVLTQKVSLAGATFPVVADPSLVCGFMNCQVQFNKKETYDISTAGLAYLGGAVAACTPAGPWAAAGCAVAAGAIAGTSILAVNPNSVLHSSLQAFFRPLGLGTPTLILEGNVNDKNPELF